MSHKEVGAARENQIFYSEFDTDGGNFCSECDWNVTEPLQMASDPTNTLETIIKGCLCLQRKRKHYPLYSRDRDSLISEKVRGGA